MKRVSLAAALALSTVPVLASDIGVSISVGQPGFYGAIDIGGFPQPQVINARPMVIERVPENRPPLYLHVPRGHIKHWNRHCHEYNACGVPVFFVKEDWYSNQYVPRYQEVHRGHGDAHDDHYRDRGEDHRGGDRHEGGDDHRGGDRHGGGRYQ